MKKLHTTGLMLLLGILLFPLAAVAQYNIPKVPDFQTSLYDYANILQPGEKRALEEKLVRYSDSTSTQIVVITIKSLNGESIGELTPRWAQEWGIGQKDTDNGVIMLLAEAERKIWISPGYGVDDRLTAGQLGEMTRDVIIPEFKAGSYYYGLDKGTDAIFQMLKGKYKGERKGGNGKQSEGFGGGIIFFIIVFIVIIIVLSKRGGGGGGGNRGRRNFGGDLADILILSSLGRGFGGGSSGGGSWGGSGGGGGGFGGGFGGGGFSGGGAGGSW